MFMDAGSESPPQSHQQCFLSAKEYELRVKTVSITAPDIKCLVRVISRHAFRARIVPVVYNVYQG